MLVLRKQLNFIVKFLCECVVCNMISLFCVLIIEGDCESIGYVGNLILSVIILFSEESTYLLGNILLIF